MNEFEPHTSTSSDPTTSLSLLKRVVGGEQDAWLRFVRIYSALIYSRCRSCGLAEQDAADVVQNVFVAVHRSLANFEHRGQNEGFRRWLRTITRNAVADYHRSRKKQFEAGGGTDMLEIFGNVPDPFADEDSLSLSGNESGDVIRETLKFLRTDYEKHTWEAFWRTAVDGEKPTDVAEDLGVKPATVRQARYKIILRLREELDGIL